MAVRGSILPPRLIVARIKAATIFCVIREIYARPTTTALRLLSSLSARPLVRVADRETERSLAHICVSSRLVNEWARRGEEALMAEEERGGDPEPT